MPPLLSVRHLAKQYPVKGSKAIIQAVSDVSFDIEPGETLALVGESGSGKTTTGRCILGLTKPTGGTILFRGEDVHRVDAGKLKRIRPKIQWVSQNPLDALDPRLTIGESVSAPVRLIFGFRGRELKNKVQELCRLVGLPDESLEQFPYELGGGYQQRAVIARSFATEPDLLVLDEPTSALDTLARADIIDLLSRLQRETSVSYLFISHDLITVQSLSTRIAVMYLGRLVEIGPTDKVFRLPRHPYTHALLGAVLLADPLAPKPTFVLSGEIPSAINLPRACALANRCPLVIEQCRSLVPPLIPVDPNHLAACIRVDPHHAGYLQASDVRVAASS